MSRALTKTIIPPLSASLKKGDAGRVGVIGGSIEYTGAPFFSAMSFLRAGGDLAHVFCDSEAAPVIKGYSPDLMVHPFNKCTGDEKKDSDGMYEVVEKLLSRIDILIIGPGLGRRPHVLDGAARIIKKARELNLPMIIDADGLQVVMKDLHLIKGYDRVVLTPNANEFKRLLDASTLDAAADPESTDLQKAQIDVKALAEALGGVTVVKKGNQDVISSGSSSAVCDEEGSLRRCGGQGDLLNGFVALFYHWALLSKNIEADRHPASVVGALAACSFSRENAKATFSKLGRSMQASDLIMNIGDTFEKMFPHGNK